MNSALSTHKPGTLNRSPFGNFFPQGFVNNMFDQFLTEAGNGQMNEMMNAAMDVAETDQAFEVKMDLPGVGAEDVDIQIDSNTLTVRGQRSDEKEEKDEEKQFHRVERSWGSFARSVTLPNSINEDETAAEFKDGVLTIIVPKTEDAKPRKITIKT